MAMQRPKTGPASQPTGNSRPADRTGSGRSGSRAAQLPVYGQSQRGGSPLGERRVPDLIDTPQPGRRPFEFAKHHGLDDSDRQRLLNFRRSMIRRFVELADADAKRQNPKDRRIGVSLTNFDAATGEVSLNVVRYSGCGTCDVQEITQRILTNDLADFCRDPFVTPSAQAGESRLRMTPPPAKVGRFLRSKTSQGEEVADSFIDLSLLKIDLQTQDLSAPTATCMSLTGRQDTHSLGPVLALESGPAGGLK